MHVLIVDDNASFCDNIGRFLLKHIPRVSHVAVAMDGMEALEKLAEFPADMALVDVRMPHLGGIELAEILHRRYPRVKVVFISAYDDSKYLKQAIRLEALDYLLKPVDYEELIRVLNRVMDRIEAENSNERRLAREKEYSVRQFLLSLIEGGEDNTGGASGVEPLLECGASFILLAMEYAVGLRMEDALNRYGWRAGQWAFPRYGGSAYLVSGYENRDFSQAFFDCQKLMEWLRREAQIPARGYLSDFVSSLPDLARARAQIERLYDVAYFKTGMRIVTYRELEGAQPFDASADPARAILDSVEKGRFPQAAEELMRLRELMPMERVYDKKGIQRFCLGLIREAAKYRVQNGGAVDELYRSDLAVMEKISAFPCLDALAEFTAGFLRGSSAAPCGQPDDAARLLSAFTAFVDENYTRPLTLDGIAARLYVSRSYLSAFVKKNLNRTVVEYVNALRLARGREMLYQTDCTVGEIAGRVGFSDGNYFIKQYKKHYGATPQADRQRRRQGR